MHYNYNVKVSKSGIYLLSTYISFEEVKEVWFLVPNEREYREIARVEKIVDRELEHEVVLNDNDKGLPFLSQHQHRRNLKKNVGAPLRHTRWILTMLSVRSTWEEMTTLRVPCTQIAYTLALMSSLYRYYLGQCI